MATRLREEHGFVVFDDQDTHSEEEVAQVRRGQRLSEAQRKAYSTRVSSLLEEHIPPTDEHPRVAYVHPFTKDRYRRKFTQRFPDSLFVLVEAPWDIQLARIQDRSGSHHASTELAVTAALENERPITVPYVVLKNH